MATYNHRNVCSKPFPHLKWCMDADCWIECRESCIDSASYLNNLITYSIILFTCANLYEILFALFDHRPTGKKHWCCSNWNYQQDAPILIKKDAFLQQEMSNTKCHKNPNVPLKRFWLYYYAGWSYLHNKCHCLWSWEFENWEFFVIWCGCAQHQELNLQTKCRLSLREFSQKT